MPYASLDPNGGKTAVSIPSRWANDHGAGPILGQRSLMQVRLNWSSMRTPLSVFRKRAVISSINFTMGGGSGRICLSHFKQRREEVSQLPQLANTLPSSHVPSSVPQFLIPISLPEVLRKSTEQCQLGPLWRKGRATAVQPVHRGHGGTHRRCQKASSDPRPGERLVNISSPKKEGSGNGYLGVIHKNCVCVCFFSLLVGGRWS